MDDSISRQAAIDALEKVAELYPWKVPGKRDTYDSYNEAWNDAIGRAEMEIETLSPGQPLVIHCTACEDWHTRQGVLGITVSELLPAQPDIIACGDCKHWICHERRCGYWNHGVKPLMWCSQAERREK